MIYSFLLRPESSLQVRGGAREGLLPRSDTLSAALMSVWKHVDPSVEMDWLVSSPPFRVSSALPWVTASSGQRVLLLPIPVLGSSNLAARTDQAVNRKTIKKVAFVDSDILCRILQNTWSLQDCRFWDAGFLATLFQGTGHYALPVNRTRLSVDRLSGGPREGILFESREWCFCAGCGWGLLASLADPCHLDVLTAALRLLGMEGLGSDRSSGMGRFEIVEGPSSLSSPDLANGAWMLLSLCCPSAADIEAGILDGRYGLIERSGWITAPGARSLRRGRIRMMTEGSCYPECVGDAPGVLVRVQEPDPALGLNHPVVRDGRALAIPIAGGSIHD